MVRPRDGARGFALPGRRVFAHDETGVEAVFQVAREKLFLGGRGRTRGKAQECFARELRERHVAARGERGQRAVVGEARDASVGQQAVRDGGGLQHVRRFVAQGLRALPRFAPAEGAQRIGNHLCPRHRERGPVAFVRERGEFP